MAVRTASSRGTRTASTQAGSIAVVSDPNTAGAYIVSGTSILANTVIEEQLTTSTVATAIAPQTASTNPPTITSYSITNSSYVASGLAAIPVAGGYLTITGTGFTSNLSVYLGNTVCTNTRISSTQINVVVPARGVRNYRLALTRPDGVAVLSSTDVTYTLIPTFTTPANIVVVSGASIPAIAAQNTTSFTITNGALPANVSFNTSTGAFTGTITVPTNNQAAWNFDVVATGSTGLTTTQNTWLIVNNLQLTINYMVVAGGGGGGTVFASGSTGACASRRGAGGGGAGGMLTGTYSCVALGAQIAITVGGGGGICGGTGSPSSILSPTTPSISVVTSGGGGGGPSTYGGSGPTFTACQPVAPISGYPGGSGGGAGGTSGLHRGGLGVPGQGNPGGNGSQSSNQFNGSGGGGAGQAGGPGTGTNAGQGAAGLVWPYTGVTYAGGGGGSYGGNPLFTPSISAGGGAGPGGGGHGAGLGIASQRAANGGNASSGEAGTGGGGGAGYTNAYSCGNYCAGPGLSGGSGIVGLTVPNNYVLTAYPLAFPGANIATPPAAPGSTVLTYTSSSTLTLPIPVTWSANAYTYWPFTTVAFTTTIRAYNATSYAVSAGNTLPAGLALSTTTTSTGLAAVISGTPTVEANSTVYIDATSSAGKVANTPINFVIKVPYVVSYLVVAGGGGGSGGNPGVGAGYGGGAGGLLQGSVTYSPNITYNISAPFSITVGGGGAGSPGNTTNPCGTTPGGHGSNSVLSGSGIATQTAIGGGGGAGYRAGQPGGSGGGSGYVNFGGTLGQGTPGQGFPGGFINACGAGGGGATAAGNTRSSPTVIAPGGAGYTWPVTGDTYSRGGDGGALNQPSVLNYATTPGYGNGGNGGNYFVAGPGTSANNGVVILSVPTPWYSGVGASGATASTPPAAPGQTVLTWTSPGSYPA